MGDGVKVNALLILIRRDCEVRILTAKVHSMSDLWRWQFNMSRNPLNMYKYHVANLRELEFAISHTGRTARSEIATKDPQKGLRSLLRLYSFLVGAWAEARLKKLLYEAGGFNESERNKITNKSTQLDQWQETINLAFRKHYNVRRAPLGELSLGVANYARLLALRNILSNELRIIIEIRNKLAHGQWVYPFNNTNTAVEQEKYQLINNENLQSLQFKYSLIKNIANVINDLVVSPVTFERDFESHFRKLFQTQVNLQTKSYEKYKNSLISKKERARAARNSA